MALLGVNSKLAATVMMKYRHFWLMFSVFSYKVIIVYFDINGDNSAIVEWKWNVFHQKDRCVSYHSFSNIVIVIHLVKRVAGEPIHVGSQKRRRIFNSESNSDNEEQEKMQTQNVVYNKWHKRLLLSKLRRQLRKKKSRKRFAILDSISDSEKWIRFLRRELAMCTVSLPINTWT